MPYSDETASMQTPAAKLEKITCKFVGDFEVADNIVRNADALCKLSTNNSNCVFNKLMVIQAGSIVEAALAQIIYRAQNYNREGVPNIPEKDRLEIADTKIERFYRIVEVMEDYEILDEMGDDIYEELHKLRKYRNKVHIQGDIDIEGVSKNESLAFSKDVVVWALSLCIRVLKHLNEHFARPKELDQFAREISIPAA